MNESAAKLIPFITPIRSCSFLPNKLQLLRTYLQNYHLFPPLYSRRRILFCSNKQLLNHHRRKIIALSVILHLRRSRLSEQLSTASNTLLSLSLRVRRFLFAKRCELSSDKSNKEFERCSSCPSNRRSHLWVRSTELTHSSKRNIPRGR